MVHYSDYHLDSRIQRQAGALADRGDHVHLVCLSEPGQLEVGRGLIRIHQVRVPKSQGSEGSYMLGYARFFVRALQRVTALSLRGRLDLVEAHNMPDFLTFAAAVPKLRGTPVILNCHDTFPELFETKFGRPSSHPAVRAIRLEERVSAVLADHVITVTEQARARLASRGVGRRSSSVVMNSPDHGVFGAPRAPSAPAAGGPIRVIYHGGLAPRFGVETLIRAIPHIARELPEVSLRVCGSGEDRPRLAALAAELSPGRIDVAAAPVPFMDIPAELEAADIGVVPTLHDGFTELLLPVKLMEYVHMGLPAVSSRLPGIQQYFGEDAIWGFEPGSPESLAAAVLAVCRRPEEARARGARATERLAEIGWDRQREQYLALVDRLTGRAEHGTARKYGRVQTVASSTAP
jgi:glycosyltransferase involved in cell wall biosynthesis